MQRKTELDASNSRVRGSLSHICFMCFEDIRNGTQLLNILYTDREGTDTHSNSHTETERNKNRDVDMGSVLF